MPLPILLLLSFASGVIAAGVARNDWMGFGGRWWLSESFSAYSIFIALGPVPLTAYFYAFHGDWFLLYLVPAGSLLSLLGLMALVLVAWTGVAGFAYGLRLARASQLDKAYRLAAGLAAAAPVLFLLAWSRVSVVGTYRQFKKDFGLAAYFESSAFFGGMLMVVLVAAGFGYLVHLFRDRYEDVA